MTTIKTSHLLSSGLFALALLLPIQALQAGGIFTDSESSTAGTNQSSLPNQSSIPNNTSFTTPPPGLGMSCLNPTGETGCAGVTNPINTMNGNKYQHDTDMAALPGIMGLEIVRSYNSLQMGLGQTGYGWQLSYEMKLYLVNNAIHIVKSDGSRIIFNRDPDNPNACACQDPGQGHVMIYPGAKGKEFTWFKLDGKQLHFNHQGKLERISLATGESTYITLGPKGELLKVTDPQGRSLVIEYASKRAKGFKGIIAIDSPIGRFEYQHNNDPKSPGFTNLILVRKPTENSQTFEQHYHYGEADYVDANMATPHKKQPQVPAAGHLLTGISHTWQITDPKDNNKTISKTKRYRTWAYYQFGRGILGVHGYPKQLDENGKRAPNTGTQQVEINYQLNDKPRINHQGELGKTIITNSLGQDTTYLYTIIAGEYRLISVVGAGCSECSTPNVVYGYDKLGRLTHITSVKRQAAKGNSKARLIPLHTQQTEYDAVGRVKRVADIAYIDGKAQTPQLRVRYAYASTPTLPKKNAINALQEGHSVQNKPSLIAKPSVVKGKEHQIHITYNERGQALTVTETGYRPAIKTPSPLQGEGWGAGESHQAQYNATSKPTKLSRTTTYTYSNINNRSLLTQVDGPLPNGETYSPQDSDITRYAYDDRGARVVQVSHPMGLNETFAYQADGAKKLISQVGMDAQQIDYRYNKTGKLIALKKAGTDIRMAYDIQNRVTQYAQHDGAKIAVHYDDQNNSITYTLPDGQKLKRQYDQDERLSKQVWLDQNGKTIVAASSVGYVDQTGRVNSITAPSGLITKRHYSQEGVLTKTEQGRKHTTQQFDAVSHLLTVNQNDAQYTLQKDPQNQQTTLTLPNGAQHSQMRDDFGRTVYIKHPETGHIIAEYNLADRITALHKAKQSQHRITTAQYDVLGRMTRQQHTEQLIQQGGTQATPVKVKKEITTYQYQGVHLVSIQHPAQDTRYQYNTLNQLTQQTVTLKQSTAKETTGEATSYHTQYTYDAFGRIAAVKLPEGATLTHLYNNIGQLNNIDYQTPAYAWWVKVLRWVKADYGTTSLIANIQTDSAHGLNSYRHNNGLKATASYDQAGRKTAWQDGAVNTKLSYNQQDELANISKATPAVFGATQDKASPETQQNLQYNVHGQLTKVGLKQAIAKAMTETYQLDLNGNRLSYQDQSDQDQTNKTQQYQYRPNSDQLLSVKGTHQTKYSYNSLGEPIQIQQQTKQTTLNRQINYGARGQIKQIQDNDKPIAHYQYNQALQRTSKTTYQQHQQQTTQYLWHGGLLDAEITQHTATQQPSISKRYFYLGLTPVAVIHYDQDAEPTIYAIHADHLGTPQAVTNTDQQVVWRAEYSTFGQATVQTGVTENTQTANNRYGFINEAKANSAQNSFAFNLRFAGQYEDKETGYHYNWHRYYDPETGRYLTPDPIGLQGGMNAYAYTNHDPMGSVDPWGLRVIISGHLAAGPLGRLTSPNSYHLSLVLVPDDPINFISGTTWMTWSHDTWGGVEPRKGICPGTIFTTIGGQPSGKPGNLVTQFNVGGDGPAESTFNQVISAPFGMSDTDFIKNIIKAAKSYQGGQKYSFPEIKGPFSDDGNMEPGEYNSNSFVAGALLYAMGSVPSLNIPSHMESTFGFNEKRVYDFQVPGYANPLPMQ